MEIFASLVAVMLKEIRQTVRDRRMMVMMLVVPVVQLFIFGNAANLDVDRIPTLVVDLDSTPASREHLQRLFADGTLTETGAYASVDLPIFFTTGVPVGVGASAGLALKVWLLEPYAQLGAQHFFTTPGEGYPSNYLLAGGGRRVRLP